MVDPETLRDAMRAWTTGVTILGVQAGGVRHGMTVSAFTSVSLSPPLVLVCIQQDVRTMRLIEASGAFGISMLRAHQSAWADRFAGRATEHEDRFEGIPTQIAVTGAPLIADALAQLDCAVEARHQGGTHAVLMARVVAALRREGEPLAYWNRSYRQLSPASG